jgi:iron complex outermembrane receptor protein
MIRCTRHSTHRRLALFALLATAAPFSITTAHAEDQPEKTSGSPASGKELDTITVTARKTRENLQDTPISISAFSGNALEQRQITSVTGIDKIIPNLVVSETAPIGGSSASASYFIRGIGQTDFTQNSEPGVGIYVDGVYIARSVGSLLQLVDLDSIEVLRGPQGTLFGRNTIGGAISVTTKNRLPISGNISAGIGSDMLLQFKGTMDVPVTDKILTKITFLSRTRNGYLTRASDGVDLGNENKFAIRGDVRLLPTDNLTIDASIERERDREHSAAEQLLAVYSGASIPAYNNTVLNGAVCGANPNASSCYTSQWVSRNGKDYGTAPSVSNADVLGISITANWHVPEPILGSDVSVKTITAWRKLDSYFTDDHDHSPVLIDHTADVYNQRQFSQELQLTGDPDWSTGRRASITSMKTAATSTMSISPSAACSAVARFATTVWRLMARRPST